jgi:hypothetical protein
MHAPGPTIMLNNGSDGPVTDMVKYGAAAAVERGWGTLTFDFPAKTPRCTTRSCTSGPIGRP